MAKPTVDRTQKQEQILQGAMQVFLTQGYEGTSMDRVAAAAGVSKQTIYSYFQDKQGLFTALIERVTIKRTKYEFNSDFQTDAAAPDPETVLRRFAKAYLSKMGDAEYVAFMRTVIGESGRFPELAQLFTQTVLKKVVQDLTAYLKAHPELELEDPAAIARIFLGTLVTHLLTQELLYGKTIIPLAEKRLVDTLVKLILKN